MFRKGDYFLLHELNTSCNFKHKSDDKSDMGKGFDSDCDKQNIYVVMLKSPVEYAVVLSKWYNFGESRKIYSEMVCDIDVHFIQGFVYFRFNLFLSLWHLQNDILYQLQNSSNVLIKYDINRKYNIKLCHINFTKEKIWISNMYKEWITNETSIF